MHSTRQLAVVTALDRHRHFGRAADSLGLSQPALTKALKGLEAALGVTLFDRGPPVAPTALGALVIARSQAIVAGFEDLKREVGLARGLDTGRLAISAGGQVAEFAAIDAVAALSRAHPFVSISLQIADHVTVMTDVLEGRADIGVAHLLNPSPHDDLVVERLRSAPYVVFCAPDHPLAGRTHATQDELLDFPWIGSSALVPPLDYPAAERRAYGDYDAATGQVRLRMRANTFGAVVRIVMHSHAISAAPARLVAPYIASGQLTQTFAPGDWPPLDYGIMLKRGRTPSPAAEAYMRELRRLETALDAG